MQESIENLLIKWIYKSQGLTMQGEQNRKGPSGATEFNKIWHFLHKERIRVLELNADRYDIECLMLEKGATRLRVMKGLPYFKNVYIMRLPRGGKYSGEKKYEDFDAESRCKAMIGAKEVEVEVVDYFRPDGALRRVNIFF